MKEKKNNRYYWLVCVVVGIIIGAVSLHFDAQSGAQWLAWLIFSYVAAMILSIPKPVGVWRWAIGITGGLLFFNICKIVQDVMKDPTADNLWPIGLFIILVISLSSSMLGAYLVKGLIKIFK